MKCWEEPSLPACSPPLQVLAACRCQLSCPPVVEAPKVPVVRVLLLFQSEQMHLLVLEAHELWLYSTSLYSYVSSASLETLAVLHRPLFPVGLFPLISLYFSTELERDYMCFAGQFTAFSNTRGTMRNLSGREYTPLDSSSSICTSWACFVQSCQTCLQPRSVSALVSSAWPLLHLLIPGLLHLCCLSLTQLCQQS